MTTLQQIISQTANLSNPEEIYNQLTAKTVKNVIANRDIDIRGIERVYGRDFTMSLLAAMDFIKLTVEAGGDASLAKYLNVQFDRLRTGSGQNFSDDLVCKQLDDLQSVGLLSEDMVTKLKALATVYKSEWEMRTQEPEPSLQDVIDAVEFESTERSRIAWVKYVKNGILANDGNGKSKEELKALIQEYE